MSRIQLPRLSRIAIAAVASAALIGTGSIAPATAFAAPNTSNAVAAASVDAAATPAGLIYNDPAGTTAPYSDTMISGAGAGSTLSHSAQLKAYGTDDRSDAPASSNIAQNIRGGSSTLVNHDAIKHLDYSFSFTNNSDKAIDLNQFALLPKYYKDVYSGAVNSIPAAEGFDANGLKSSQITTSDGSTGQLVRYSVLASSAFWDWAGYQAAGHGLADMEEIWITGSLNAGQTLTLTVPLTVPAASATSTISVGEVTGTGGLFDVYRLNARADDPLKNSDGSNAIPFAGKILPVTKAADGSYTALPQAVASLMPDAVNDTNYWVSNFGKSAVAGTTQSALFNGGYYTVDASKGIAALNSHGYAAATLNTDGTQVTSETRQVATDPVTIKASADGTTAQTTDHDAALFEVRQVITGNDATITAGSTLDAASALGLKVCDRTGKIVALPSTDVTIDTSKVNANVAGTYPVTVTYTPDGVSNTFNVTVKALSATPVAPTQSGNTVTIPTVTGVDYQVDGKTVTGTVTVPDGQTVTVIAVPQEGYAFPDGATTSWDFSYNVPTTPTPGESGSTNPGQGTGTNTDSGTNSGSNQSASGTQVQTSGTSTTNGLAGIGVALAAAGAAIAAAARKLHRNR